MSKLKPKDAIALKYITAQAELNHMIQLNKELEYRLSMVLAVKKNKVEFKLKRLRGEQ